jgi:transcriptional regulator with XRE-family HTH domain
MTTKIDIAKLVRRVRERLGVSQEGLSRRLNSTKGAVQHWERGRNRPDLARLLALRHICPPGPERKQLDALIKEAQSRAVQPPEGSVVPLQSPLALHKDNVRLRQQISRLEAQLQKRSERLRILEELAADLQRQMSELRGSKASGVSGTSVTPS